jgi:uncharacterized protein
MIEPLWLLPVGTLLGGLGTLIGAGGGFLLMPLLLILYPNDSPELLTGISLATVFFNGASGSFAYIKKKRVDFWSAKRFIAAALPGAMVGAYLIGHVPMAIFRPIFGAVLLLGGGSLVLRARRAATPHTVGTPDVERKLIEANGETWVWSYSRKIAYGLAAIVGVLSSMLGIGGGIIHVPAMIGMLGFPVHLATATSHLVLAVTALAALLVRAATGTFGGALDRVAYLAIGAVIGAQIGAAISDRIKGPWIIRTLAIALMLVGVRILLLG